MSASTTLPAHILRAPGLHAMKRPSRKTPPARPQQNMRISNASSRDVYDGAELRPFEGRPGAADALTIPSRVNNRLHYRDGRVTDMQGSPVAA